MALNFDDSFTSWQFPGPGEVGLRWMHEGNRDFMPRGPSKIWMGFVPAVNVMHPENAKIILKTTGFCCHLALFAD